MCPRNSPPGKKKEISDVSPEFSPGILLRKKKEISDVSPEFPRKKKEISDVSPEFPGILRINQGKNSNIYFFRDNVGNEVDVLLEDGTSIKPVEVKLGSTINEDYFKGLRYYQKLNKKNTEKPALIYGGAEDQHRRTADVFSYRNVEKINS